MPSFACPPGRNPTETLSVQSGQHGRAQLPRPSAGNSIQDGAVMVIRIRHASSLGFLPTFPGRLHRRQGLLPSRVLALPE